MATKPTTIAMALKRWMSRDEPHERKNIEVTIILRADSKEWVAQELESLADKMRQAHRDGMVGFAGHGAGYHMTVAWAARDLTYKEKNEL